MSSSNTHGASLGPLNVESFARVVAEQVIGQFAQRGFTTPEYLSTQQAAAYTGLSVDWFAKARQTDDGPPFIKISPSQGGSVRYKKSDLDAWLAERRIGGER